MCLQLPTIYWGHFANCFIYSFVFQVISVKTLCSKGFTCNLRDFCVSVIAIFTSYKFSRKFDFISLFSFNKKQKQE